MQNESLSERYLGMPTEVGHSKNGTFKYLRDRVWEKIKGWMEKLLSAAGKEVLIKSMLQATPMFSMSYFKFAKKITCRKLTYSISLKKLYLGFNILQGYHVGPSNNSRLIQLTHT